MLLLLYILGLSEISRDPVLTGQDEGQVLQVREQEVLAGPQIAHGGT